MRFFEFITPIPPTPEQDRINSLRQQKDNAATALTAERTMQKRQKATQAIQKNNQVLAKLNNP
jgi:hypothetical protein